MDAVMQWTVRNLPELDGDDRRRLTQAFMKGEFDPNRHVASVRRYPIGHRLALKEVQTPMIVSLMDGCETITLAHGTSAKGCVGILRTRKVRAFSWREGGAGCHGIYCVGTTEQGDSSLMTLVNRVPRTKNGCNIIFEGTARAVKRVVRGGGIEYGEAPVCRQGYVTNYAPEHRWCCPQELFGLTAMWIVGRPFADSDTYLFS
jgi:hypothetical protein